MPTDSYAIALHSERPIDPAAVRALFDSLEWWPGRSADAIGRVLQQGAAVGAWDGPRLIGFARSVTDGGLRAFIEDVVVHPDYQNQAVGKHLLDRLLSELEGIETITLFSRVDLASWYEQFGFRRQKSQVVLHRAGPVGPRCDEPGEA